MEPIIGTLGYPLGEVLSIEGAGADEPTVRNAFRVERVGRKALAAPLLVGIRGEVARIQPGRRRTLVGFESVEWLGAPPGIEAFVPAAERVRLGDWRPMHTFVTHPLVAAALIPAALAPALPPSPMVEPWGGRLGHIVGTLLATEGTLVVGGGRVDYFVESVEGKPLGREVRLELSVAAPERGASVLVDGYEVAWYARSGWEFGFRALRIRPQA